MSSKNIQSLLLLLQRFTTSECALLGVKKVCINFGGWLFTLSFGEDATLSTFKVKAILPIFLKMANHYIAPYIKIFDVLEIPKTTSILIFTDD